MAKKMLPDPPSLKKLQISAQADLLEIHQQIRTLLSTLVMRTNLKEYTIADLHTYLGVIYDLSDRGVILLEQIIRSLSMEEEEEDA